MEYGLIIPRGNSYINKYLPGFLEDPENELSTIGRSFLYDLLGYLAALQHWQSINLSLL